MKLYVIRYWQTKSNVEKNKTSNEHWINYSICVGNVAGRIAKALNLDEDFAKTLGYIHDIGKRIVDCDSLKSKVLMLTI